MKNTASNRLLASFRLTASSIVLSLALLFSLMPSAASAASDTAFFFRLFNPRTNDHFYTTDIAEKNTAIRRGFVDEGIVGAIFTADGIRKTPLFRLFKKSTGDYFYTVNPFERDAAIASGYVFEKVAGYVQTDPPDPGSLPFFRLYNRGLSSHFYTTNLVERKRAVEKNGFAYEGIVGYLKPRLYNLIRPRLENNQKIVSPVKISGKARGSWFFEGSFPILILDSKGKVLTTSFGQAQGEWMTNEFVEFVSPEIRFQRGEAVEGFVILQKDNPSGLSQFDDELVVPVRF